MVTASAIGLTHKLLRIRQMWIRKVACPSRRLQEQAELAMMGDTFGTGGLNELDKFVPKTQDDFDNYARMVASRYITSFFGKVCSYP